MGGGLKSLPKKRHDFTVLVTGQGPFPDGQGGHYQHNTSHMITKRLPPLLPTSHLQNPTSLPIRILNPTAGPGQYVKTEYAYIRQYVQKMWDEYEDQVDLVLHLGMADGWEWFTIEQLAFNEKFTSDWWGPGIEKEGYYMIPDDVGKTVRDIKEDEGKGIWDGLPLGLQTRIDVDKAVQDAMVLTNAGCHGGTAASETDSVDHVINMGGRLNERVVEDSRSIRVEESKIAKPKINVIPHLEAGFYCCGFIYYESLATVRKRYLDVDVLFAHVPGWRDAERLGRGADLICAIIGSACKQIEAREPRK